MPTHSTITHSITKTITIGAAYINEIGRVVAAIQEHVLPVPPALSSDEYFHAETWDDEKAPHNARYTLDKVKGTLTLTWTDKDKDAYRSHVEKLREAQEARREARDALRWSVTHLLNSDGTERTYFYPHYYNDVDDAISWIERQDDPDRFSLNPPITGIFVSLEAL